MTENKMEVMEIKKLVLTMSIPIMISMLVQALYNIVDSMFVARVSEDALAAVSLCSPIQTIMVAVACGTGVGINAMMSRYLGQHEQKKAQSVLCHGLILSVISGIVFAILGLFGTTFFLNLFTHDSLIIQLGEEYLSICTSLSVFVFVQIAYERIMQATGHAFYNMIMQGVGALINIIFDPIFIFVLGFGVKGAAIATVLGQMIAMMIGIWITNKKIKEVEVNFKDFSLNWIVIKEIYQIGVPAILIQSIMSFMTVFMNMILIAYGALTVSVFGIYFKLSTFIFMAVNGINNALIPIVSFNYGGRHFDRIFKAVRFSLLLTICIMFLGTCLAWGMPDLLLALFDASKQMLDIGIPAIRIIGLCFIPAGINVILGAALQATGFSKASLMITLCRQLFFLIPLSYVLMNLFGLEIGWSAFVITETLCMLISLAFYRRTCNQIQRIERV